jgi:metal-dependent hydrolase (beta-lactamase superfamily II)
VRITTLSENTAGKRPKGLLAEYGRSIPVETAEQTILFDTGQSISAVHKAYGLQRRGVSHCTGPEASARLAAVFGDRFFFYNAGCVIELGSEKK